MWPPNSPDLSPIKNAWDYLERQVKKWEHQPKNPDELWAALEEEWNRPSFGDYVKRLYDSVPMHMEKLLKAKGKWTKY
ncbi:hypothetical protein BT96DRAFT_809756 [Gymnopus androsaceus JB14]|uniref:Tc1-like transposase DDE domain-containing protein n=1 Tax=Gymnopus androsaceus JB14 TaxID=1447944 RepID=A0A6A4I5C9_9AGAR|nr:hypothetical protein BT96DRAFT_809756 [Gymnopus androsaceus JB14]